MTRAKQSLALFLPHIKSPAKNSWLKDINYFSKVKGLLTKENNSKTWTIHPGIYQQEDYMLTVLNCDTVNKEPQLLIKPVKKLNLQLATQDSKKTSGASGLKLETVIPIKERACSEILNSASANMIASSDAPLEKNIKICSSKDFIQFTAQTENQKKSSFSFRKTKNILFKTSLGNQLHFFLQKLFYFPAEKLNHLIQASPFLSQEDQEKIKKALTYIQNIKEPNISSFFKTGYSEWSFKFQKKNIVLTGQIDLWSWSGEEISLLDYKSGGSKNVKNQLIFYSWVLDQMYQPKTLWMYECYPLEEKIEKTLYQPQHKELFENWLESLIADPNVSKEDDQL